MLSNFKKRLNILKYINLNKSKTLSIEKDLPYSVWLSLDGTFNLDTFFKMNNWCVTNIGAPGEKYKFSVAHQAFLFKSEDDAMTFMVVWC